MSDTTQNAETRQIQSVTVPGLSSTSKNTITSIAHDQNGRAERLLVCSKRTYHVVDLKKSHFDQIQADDVRRTERSHQLSANDPSCVKFCNGAADIFALLSHHAHIELERINPTTGAVVKVLPPEKTLRHNRYVTDIDWSPPKSVPKLAATSKDNDLKIWRLEMGKIESKVKPLNKINLVSYSELIKWCPFSLPSKSNGEDSLIAHTRSTGQRIQIMDIRSKDFSVRAVNLNDTGMTVNARSIDFNRDGLMMVLAHTTTTQVSSVRRLDSFIKVYDLRNEKVELVTTPQIELATDARFTPDGQYIMALAGSETTPIAESQIRTSRDGMRNSRLLQIDLKGQTRNVLRDVGLCHWDASICSDTSSTSSSRSYAVTTVAKRASGERNNRNYYDIVLAKYAMSVPASTSSVDPHYPDPFEHVESANDDVSPLIQQDERHAKIRRAIKALSDEKSLLSEKSDHIWDLTIRPESEQLVIKCASALTLTLTFPIDYDDRDSARLLFKDVEYFNEFTFEHRVDLIDEVKRALASKRKSLQDVKSILLSRMEKSVTFRRSQVTKSTSESSNTERTGAATDHTEWNSKTPMPAVIGINWCGTKLVVFQNAPILSSVAQYNKSNKPYSYQLQEEVLNQRRAQLRYNDQHNHHHHHHHHLHHHHHSPKNTWTKPNGLSAYRGAHRQSISRGNSIDGRTLRSLNSQYSTQQQQQQQQQQSRSAQLLQLTQQRSEQDKKTKVSVYALDHWLVMDRDQTAVIGFDHLEVLDLEEAQRRMFRIVERTVDRTLETNKLRPIHRHLLNELKSLITTIYEHCEVKRAGAWAPWRDRMKTKIEDLVTIMIRLADCQFVALLAFFLHAAPNPQPKSTLTYMSILNLSSSCQADLRRESRTFAQLLERWRLPIVRALFIKGFASQHMLQRGYKQRQEKAERQERRNRSGKSDKKLLSILGDGIQPKLSEKKTNERNILACVICRKTRGSQLRIICSACHHCYHPNCHQDWFEDEDECAELKCTCQCQTVLL